MTMVIIINRRTYVIEAVPVPVMYVRMFGDRDRSKAAQAILVARAFRKRLFPSEIFDEYAWAMLLVLFIGFADGEVISEIALLERAGVSVPVGRRWIAHLVGEDQIELREDGDGVMLSENAITKLRIFLDEACDFSNLFISIRH